MIKRFAVALTLLALLACPRPQTLPTPSEASGDAKASLYVATRVWKEATTSIDNLCRAGVIRYDRCAVAKKYSDIYRENAKKAYADLDRGDSSKFDLYYQYIYDALTILQSMTEEK